MSLLLIHPRSSAVLPAVLLALLAGAPALAPAQSPAPSTTASAGARAPGSPESPTAGQTTQPVRPMTSSRRPYVSPMQGAAMGPREAGGEDLPEKMLFLRERFSYDYPIPRDPFFPLVIEAVEKPATVAANPNDIRFDGLQLSAVLSGGAGGVALFVRPNKKLLRMRVGDAAGDFRITRITASAVHALVTVLGQSSPRVITIAKPSLSESKP